MKKVLIADDEPNILILMEQILEELEEENEILILTARNGTEALEIIQKEQPDLVFLDVMMPQMSGLEVCEQVKQTLKIADIYIILLTARGQAFDRDNGIAVGADLYITKPFRPKEVLKKSKEILGINQV
ncbi:response regulator [Crocosphaera sp. UHCC 0190]|uniref:response regulator n=1 Tax=Crocosphaera sp. UHCC 0190 TaxID=3110246 RepID=UPI002B1EA5BE|nr:response regulator [Crocosphaera sp. UHCC 0190]MEA5509129.1 response regulator [Crocosphaera sp. UHCC 0190]